MLENIEIVDYKCFKDFKLDGLSRINIISGGNNVGKTALLEAILLIKNTNHIRSFIQTIKFIFESRDLIKDDVDTFLETINLSFKKNNIKITIQHKFIDDLNDAEIDEVNKYKNDNEEFLVMNIDKVIQIIPIFRFRDSMILSRKYQSEMIFINSSKPDNTKLTELYSAIQDLELQENFLNYLRIIDKNIVGLEPQLKERGKSFLRVSLQNPKQSLLSSELGEGTNRFIEILASLLKNSDGTVFIDEIENGIHYSKLKDIAKAIIEIVQKENIQLFITTHDKETIEAFSEACEELDFKDISSVELYKDKENIIQSVVRNFEQFIATVDAGMEVR